MKLKVEVIILGEGTSWLPVLVVPFAADQTSRLPFRPRSPPSSEKKGPAVNEINTDIRSAQPELRGKRRVLVGETGRERLSEKDRNVKYL